MANSPEQNERSDQALEEEYGDVPDGTERAEPIAPPNITKAQEKEIRKYIRKSQLTFREILFVDYFTGTLKIKNHPPLNWNGTQSAIAAGYSAKTAGNKAFDLVRKPEVKAMIEDRLKDLLALARVTAAKTINHYAAIAYQDPINLFDKNGDLKNVVDMDESARLAIASIEVDEKTVVSGEKTETTLRTKKIKMIDKTKGLDAMKEAMKMAGVDYTINLVHQGADGGAVKHEIIDLSRKTPAELAEMYRGMVRKDTD